MTRLLSIILRNVALLLLAHHLGGDTRRRWPVALAAAMLAAAWIVLDFSYFAKEKHID